ncbi:MAG: ABC transporter ATP-binding protein [Proteobacteria bacterium]|nr:ABC transporter ATP-binding protein [Pseudomonadota bacterium]
MKELIKLIDIKKTFFVDSKEIEILKGINLTIYEGDFVAIIGASGSGKSTLMNIIGCMDRPTSGQYYLAGRDVLSLNDDELSFLRNEFIGFVFQQFHLIGYAKAIENVILPTIYSRQDQKNVKHRAIELLKMVNMEHRINSKPNQLSGGEQQRVAIARALINNPQIILADEPTGALDSKTSNEIMDIFTNLNNNGKTIIIITHEKDIAGRAKKIIKISDGIIV